MISNFINHCTKPARGINAAIQQTNGTIIVQIKAGLSRAEQSWYKQWVSAVSILTNMLTLFPTEDTLPPPTHTGLFSL